MENALYIGLSRQNVIRTNMNIIANNIANINTPGFRGQNLVFQEVLSGKTGENKDSFVANPGMYEVTTPGTISPTGNALDIALTGPGFIQVEGPGGVPAYTRAGNLDVSKDGELMTASGYKVIGGGGPIQLPREASQISIDENGVISSEFGDAGKISVVEFDNIQKLEALGHNLYTTDAASKPAEETRVIQGSVENSNVNGVMEMTRMIEVTRSYQSIQRFMSSEHDRLRSTIQKLTQTT